MDYSYLDFSHLDSILEIERESNPFPWTERNFTDCLEKGYYSLALEDDKRGKEGYCSCLQFYFHFTA